MAIKIFATLFLVIVSITILISIVCWRLAGTATPERSISLALSYDSSVAEAISSVNYCVVQV